MTQPGLPPPPPRIELVEGPLDNTNLDLEREFAYALARIEKRRGARWRSDVPVLKVAVRTEWELFQRRARYRIAHGGDGVQRPTVRGLTWPESAFTILTPLATAEDVRHEVGHFLAWRLLDVGPGPASEVIAVECEGPALFEALADLVRGWFS